MADTRIRVLLIEDDEDDYVLVRSILSEVTSTEYDLEWAPSYDAALKAIDTARHDVYLLDYYLGERNGLELLKEIGKRGLATPVIFLTGQGDYETDVQAMRLGTSDYLVKGQINGPLLERAIRYSITQRITEDKLRQAQKMEALGTLAGGIAHDFNNLLGAVIGFTELIQDDLPEGNPGHGHAARVLEAGIRGRDLVKQMLTFSRKTDQEKKPLRLSSIVKESAKLLRSSIPTTITMNVNVTSESGLILADPVQIQQVVMNLCTNAYHAMLQKGGTLNIELSDYSVGLSDGNSHGIEPGLYMKLTVRDTGMGIPAEIRDRIFDPFFTTKIVGEGTGLGLSVVMGIVKQSDGYITVESEPGKGSTFTVYFPKFRGELAADIKEEVLPTGTERILFVDDEEALLEMGEQLLAKLGYKVTRQMSSEVALALIEENPSRFDLVITDQTMPDMTGEELAKKILAIRPDMPVILCTGFSHLVDADSAKAAGIKGFAMKPLTKKEIAKTVREVLDGKNSA